MVHCVPQVSVIVPVRNAGRGVEELISKLRLQTLPTSRFEVIVADDGSVDGCATSLDADGQWLRVLALPARTSYAARNAAAATARAPILAFCDADCRPERGWLEHGIDALNETEIAAGRVKFMPTRRPTTWTLLDVDAHLNQEHAVRRGVAATANLFVRSTLFTALGGFDGSLRSNGDYEFVARAVAAGARLVYAPNAVVWHPPRNSMRAFLGKIWRTNHSAAVRAGRSGRNPFRRRPIRWVPVVGALDARLRAGKPAGLNRARLEAEGFASSAAQRTAATVALYAVIPPVRVAARLAGWLSGRIGHARMPA
jgi:glycosyltransferase involved in cell wall biosynthesis